MHFNQDDDTSVLSIYKNIVSCEEQIKFVLSLMYSVAPKMQDKFHDEVIKLEGIFKNLELMRKIRYRDSVVKDHPSEYFGKDYGDDDVFKFDEELEGYIQSLSLELLNVIGKYVRLTSTAVISLDEET